MTIRDVKDIGKLVAYTLIAWLLPARYWRKAAMAIPANGRLDGCWPAYRFILTDRYSESEITRISTQRRVYVRELNLQILGLNRPWRSWRPDIRLNGAAHLRNALEGGHGTILWVTETAFSTLIVKMALHNAGYQACQLSRPRHGFSDSSFSVRFFNPLWTRVENRFIAERILIVGESATEAMAALRARLHANRIVIITVGPWAHKLVEVPFFRTQLKLPTGPIRLARTTDAVLLPVFAIAKVNGGFEVSIQEPLYPTGGQADDESVAAAYAKRLEPFVLEYPDQWKGWEWLMK